MSGRDLAVMALIIILIFIAFESCVAHRVRQEELCYQVSGRTVCPRGVR
jgi:hypothetical protein